MHSFDRGVRRNKDGAMTITRMGFFVPVLLAAFVSGCVTTGQFDSRAWAPRDADDLVVKVSLNAKNAYVLEGDRLLLATPVTIGTPEDPTPKGEFTIFRKIEKKRSYTYGFHVGETGIRPGKSADTPPACRYVGYPMPYWLEFHPGYGFHAGGVWPEPRSHGCLRVHKTVAPKLFAMCPTGTKVLIADSHPEDATVGNRVVRPTDYADPDPPASLLITEAAFPPPQGPLFEPEPAPVIQ